MNYDINIRTVLSHSSHFEISSKCHPLKLKLHFTLDIILEEYLERYVRGFFGNFIEFCYIYLVELFIKYT